MGCAFAILVLGTVSAVHSGPALLLTAEVESDPAKITLRWAPHPEGVPARGISVWRKTKDSNSWGKSGFGGFVATYATGSGPADSWTDPDPDLRAGMAYEYRVHLHPAKGTTRVGFILAGIEVPPVHSRGRIILVVDRTLARALSKELIRLADDLVGDGWTVTPAVFDRGLPLTDGGYGRQVRDLHRIIKQFYNAHPEDTRAVLLIGHLPVPYTGNQAYDWHDPMNDGRHAMPWHIGAWPADVYYGEMTWEWKDERVKETRSDFPANHNVPGDGKFDPASYDHGLAGDPPQGTYPGPELWVGRVDLHDLPAFKLDEEQLLRRYLDKHHAYRHRHRSYERRGLIDYNIKEAARGLNENNGPHRSFAALFGPDNVHANPAVDWFTTLGKESYLWAAGAGYSGFTHVGGIGTTADFASKPARVVFTALFGSYFGDWNNRDNILRAPLANEDILTCVWLGPQINANFGLTMHHMALGEPIGYAVDANHYRGRIYHESSMTLIGGLARGLQINLMGDPTLRLHVVAPVTNVTLSLPDKDTQGCLSWKTSPETSHSDFSGYYVYAADDRHGPFTILNSERPISTTSFELPKEPKRFYMVRAAKLERTPSGTYHNLSQGIIVSNRP
jgi:hypothetical protein